MYRCWNRYKSATPDYREKLKLTDGKPPPDFVERLCFLRTFRAGVIAVVPKNLSFRKKKKLKSQSGVFRIAHKIMTRPSCWQTKSARHTSCARSSFTGKYVSVWKAKDSADYAIEFVPTWKNDNRVYKRIISGSANGDLTWEDNKAQPLIAYNLGQHKEVARVFTGDVVRAKKIDAPFRFYRVLDKGQTQVTLLPTHVAKDKSGAAQIAFGVKKSGIKLNWPVFISEYELPHPPSVKPQPAGSTEA